jgi:serine/threonine-protein kinase
MLEVVMNSRTDAGDSDALLDEVVGAYLQAAEGNREPDREIWLARYPEISKELSEFFADRDRVQGWTAPLRAAAQHVHSGTPSPENDATAIQRAESTHLNTPRQFGDYELLSCLGRGGMGVVYKARQISLNRLVALKMIHTAEVGTDIGARRFHLEAELVAQLDHPQIVPVYEVGERDGRHFFSMKLIEGGNLAAQIDYFRAQPLAAASLLALVSQAVHHAHQRGILHRDLKPSNILLEWRTGDCSSPVPHVTDFGLAKRIATDSQLTESGLIVGSPSYMAPEQAGAHAGAMTTATDVYGLGVILYTLLTARPPFAGDSVLDTLAQVRTGEPVPPRRLNADVPRDLETICLKCMAKEPGHRYTSAAHLAEELNRFLDGKPILARPAGPLVRLTKWARRRPAVAALIGVSALAAAALVGVSLAYHRQLQGALKQAEASASEAREGREQASANYREAREAVRQMLGRVTSRSRADVPNLQELRREQQEDALAFFLGVAKQQSDDPEIQADVAEARRQAGLLQMHLGRSKAAQENLEQARDLLLDLAARFPGMAIHRNRLADSWNLLGALVSGPDEPVLCHRRALELYDQLCREDANNPEYQDGLMAAYHNLGAIAWGKREGAEAEDMWKRALVIGKELMHRYPGERKHLARLAKTQLNLSVMFQQQKGREEEAAELHDQAESALDRLVREDRHDYESIEALAALRINWAYVLLNADKPDRALADLDKNIKLLSETLQVEPKLAWIRDKLYSSYGARFNIFDSLGRYREAVAAYEQVVALSDPAMAPTNRINLALLRMTAGDYKRAVTEVDNLIPELPSQCPWQSYHDIAHVYCQAISAAVNDKELTEADRRTRNERWALAALHFLEKARANAPAREWNEHLPQQKLIDRFKPLSEREDFRRWLKGNS